MATNKHPRETHGMSKTKIYALWNSMNMRCTKPSQWAYKHYGGRGIKVCDRWKTFENFYEDMGKNYKPGLSIERIDVNGNYEPSNCCWVTRKEQMRNRTDTTFFTINGIRKNLSAWIEDAAVGSSTVRQRYYVYKWSIEESLFLPVGSKARRIAS